MFSNSHLCSLLCRDHALWNSNWNKKTKQCLLERSVCTSFHTFPWMSYKMNSHEQWGRDITELDSLFGHLIVVQNIHVDRQRLLMATQSSQQYSTLFEKAWSKFSMSSLPNTISHLQNLSLHCRHLWLDVKTHCQTESEPEVFQTHSSWKFPERKSACFWALPALLVPSLPSVVFHLLRWHKFVKYFCSNAFCKRCHNQKECWQTQWKLEKKQAYLQAMIARIPPWGTWLCLCTARPTSCGILDSRRAIGESPRPNEGKVAIQVVRTKNKLRFSLNTRPNEQSDTHTNQCNIPGMEWLDLGKFFQGSPAPPHEASSQPLECPQWISDEGKKETYCGVPTMQVTSRCVERNSDLQSVFWMSIQHPRGIIKDEIQVFRPCYKTQNPVYRRDNQRINATLALQILRFWTRLTKSLQVLDGSVMSLQRGVGLLRLPQQKVQC